jgi:4-hydroxybenzoate polyprenyltransferase
VQSDRCLKKLDYFFITRPILFFPGWNTLLAGYLVAKGEVLLLSGILHDRWHFALTKGNLLLTLLAFMSAMGGCFILNQLQDVESDRQNQKLFLIGEKYVRRNSARWESIILLTMALIIGCFLNFAIFSLLLLFVFITGYLYNYRPFRFKNRPLWGLVSNMLMGWIAFALGWSLSRSLDLFLLVDSLPYLALNTSLYLLTTTPDAAGDEVAGKNTFCVSYGFKTTLIVSLLLYSFSLIFSIFGNDQLILLLNLLVLYSFLRLVFSLSLTQAVLTIKMTIFFFSFLICLKFPWYILLMVPLFFFTRFYYHQRFQFDYPHFRGD